MSGRHAPPPSKLVIGALMAASAVGIVAPVAMVVAPRVPEPSAVTRPGPTEPIFETDLPVWEPNKGPVVTDGRALPEPSEPPSPVPEWEAPAEANPTPEDLPEREPEPTTERPAPTTTEPAPTTTTTTEPAPTTTEPAPTTTEPAPTTTEPAPTTEPCLLDVCLPELTPTPTLTGAP